MTIPTIIPVVLSGGSGTRLWPLSRELYPKQFLPLLDSESLFQQTLARLEGLAGLHRPIVVCNDEHRFLVAEQLREADCEAAILLEPEGRNTAPAAALSALEAEYHGMGDACLLVLPADHVMTAPEAFRTAVKAGSVSAEAGELLTFGIIPTAAETGYGYIKVQDFHEPMVPPRIHRVGAFVEKPAPDLAQEFVASGTYLWNSGIFLFQASRYLQELERFAPEILAASRAAFEASTRDLDFLRLDREAFAACPSDSIDYAVMEKTDAAAVVPMDPGWSDLGSWSTLHQVNASDSEGNTLQGDVIAQGTRNSYLRAESRLLATIGLDEHVVIETADAVLVAHRSRAQEVKEVVDRLKGLGRAERVMHRRVHRPWGSYECINAGERFQVKRITIRPAQTLSLQCHFHRAEHWVIVRGTARVLRGDEEFLLAENQSTYIPLGHVHRIANPGKIPLELIEVQTGSYLGEDDIMRLEDYYGRAAGD